MTPTRRDMDCNLTTNMFFQGCGYPPRTVCKDFTEEYAANGTTFRCFVSRADPGLVIVDLDLDQAGDYAKCFK